MLSLVSAWESTVGLGLFVFLALALQLSCFYQSYLLGDYINIFLQEVTFFLDEDAERPLEIFVPFVRNQKTKYFLFLS